MERRISIIQMDVRLGDLKSNLKLGLKRIEKATDKGSDFVVLPELWPTSFAYKSISSYPSNYHEEILTLVQNLAYKGKICIIAGTICEFEGGKFYNTCYVVGSSGDILGKYRKIHLFKQLKEDQFFTPGNSPKVIQTKFGKIGLAVCYDLRFPEIFRALAVNGAEIIFVPAEFPAPRVGHWLTLLRARAIENQCFVVGANRVGKIGDLEYFGRSVIFDPYGNTIDEGGSKEEIITADIELDEILKVRQMLPTLSERRPEAYEIHRKPAEPKREVVAEAKIKEDARIETQEHKTEPPKEDIHQKKLEKMEKELEELRMKEEKKEAKEKEEKDKKERERREQERREREKREQEEKIRKEQEKALAEEAQKEELKEETPPVKEEIIEDAPEIKVKEKKKTRESENILKTSLSFKETSQPMRSRS